MWSFINNKTIWKNVFQNNLQEVPLRYSKPIEDGARAQNQEKNRHDNNLPCESPYFSLNEIDLTENVYLIIIIFIIQIN